MGTADPRWVHLVEHGTFTMAYSTLDAELQHFHLPGIGYLSYQSRTSWMWGKSTLAFFDPICDSPSKLRLLNAFVEQEVRPGFVQIERETAEILAEMGYFVNSFGVETRVPLAGFSLRGRGRARLREAMNRAHRVGARIEEIGEGSEQLWEQMRCVSGEWIGSRKLKRQETRLITRRAVFHEEPFVRKFVLFRDGALEGFVFFDPIFRDRRVVGYTPSVQRFRLDAFKGWDYFVVLSALELFRQEGVEFLDLGLSPFYNMTKDVPGRRSGATSWVFHRLAQCEKLYGFRGLAEHKRQFRADERPTFVALPSWAPVGFVYSGLKMTGLL